VLKFWEFLPKKKHASDVLPSKGVIPGTSDIVGTKQMFFGPRKEKIVGHGESCIIRGFKLVHSS